MRVPPLAALALLLYAGVGRAAAPAPDLHAVTERVHAVGAKQTLVELDRRGALDAVLDRIGEGATPWIGLAPDLAKGADGAAAEGLGRALPRNPVAVLQAIDGDDAGIIGVRTVCGLPFIEATAASNAAYKRRAVAAVSRVQQPELKAKRGRCLAQLRS